MQKNESRKAQSLKSKIENFWYYYKIPVLIILCIAGILMLCFCGTNKTVASDLRVSLISTNVLTEGSINFNEAMPGLISDINNDGEANITITRLFIGEDSSEENSAYALQGLESQLAEKGATLFLFDQVNFDRMIKKDAFCPLDEFFDTRAYKDKVIYRDEVPIAFSLSGSKVLGDLELNDDALYAMLLFRRPDDENNAMCNGEYQNAVIVLTELLKES